MFSASFRNRCSVGVLAGVMALVFAAFSQAQDKDAKGSETKRRAGSQTDPLKRPIPEKQRKANAKALKIELSKTYRSGWTRTCAGSSPTRKDPPSCSSRTTKSATSSLRPSGNAAIPRPTPKRTSLRKSTTGASRMPTSTSRPVSPVGRPTAAGRTSCLGRRMRSSPILPAAATAPHGRRRRRDVDLPV